jgi:hypothetical protein
MGARIWEIGRELGLAAGRSGAYWRERAGGCLGVCAPRRASLELQCWVGSRAGGGWLGSAGVSDKLRQGSDAESCAGGAHVRSRSIKT